MVEGYPSNHQPFRFFDNREKYLLFVTTCSEKRVIAERVAMEFRHIHPTSPALKVFDAGMGDGTVLNRVMRRLHRRFPTVPFLIVGKEISQEDVRISLEKMPDRFFEHPQTVLVITNLLYREAPWLYPISKDAQERLNWLEVPLKGDSAFEFDEQIKALEPHIQQQWQTAPSPKTGNPLYVHPSVMVIYREDQKWPLDPIIPQKGNRNHDYDLVIASQPYRARLPAQVKVRNVLKPLVQCLALGGRMIGIQSTGKDPGMEIIRHIWPNEDPFQTPRRELLHVLKEQFEEERSDLRYLSYDDRRSQFRYKLHMRASELEDNIGISTLLAGWNAAIYVAQIEDERLEEAISQGAYLDATRTVLQKYEGLWFADESFVVARNSR